MHPRLKPLALSAVFLLSPLAPATADVPETDGWLLAYEDANGGPTDLRMAHRVVGFVRGPDGFVLELVCNERDQMAFRMARRDGSPTRFTGESFEPRVVVRRGGQVLLDQTFRRAFNFRPAEEAYQGPVRARLMEALRDGANLVVREPGGTLNVIFNLRGSAAVIDALPCSAEE